MIWPTYNSDQDRSNSVATDQGGDLRTGVALLANIQYNAGQTHSSYKLNSIFEVPEVG